MSNTEMTNHLKRVFHQVAPEIEFEKIDLRKSLTDQVEIDSFDFYNIVVRLEKETGIRIPDSVLRSLPHLQSLIDYLETRKNHMVRSRGTNKNITLDLAAPTINGLQDKAMPLPPTPERPESQCKDHDDLV